MIAQFDVARPQPTRLSFWLTLTDRGIACLPALPVRLSVCLSCCLAVCRPVTMCVCHSVFVSLILSAEINFAKADIHRLDSLD